MGFACGTIFRRFSVGYAEGRASTDRHPWTRECWHRFHRCINWVSVPVVGGGRGRGGVVTRTSSPEDCAAWYIFNVFRSNETFSRYKKNLQNFHFRKIIVRNLNEFVFFSLCRGDFEKYFYF